MDEATDWAEVEEGWVDPQPLHTAAQDGDLLAVRRLIENGWEVGSFDVDNLGWTPLHFAVIEGHVEVAACLLAAGADVNAHDESVIGNTPLRQVAENCSIAVARMLVAAGADPTIEGWMRLTALHKSAERNDGDGPTVHALLLAAARRLGRPVGKPGRSR